LRQSDLKSLYDNVDANRKEILRNQNSLNRLVSDSTEMLNTVKAMAAGQVGIRDGQEKILNLLDALREEGKKDTKTILSELEIVQKKIMDNFDKMSYNIMKFDLDYPADRLLFYLRIVEHLSNSNEVFHNQNKVQGLLTESLRKNEYPVPSNMGYD
jgi:hypothetical protein